MHAHLVLHSARALHTLPVAWGEFSIGMLSPRPFAVRHYLEHEVARLDPEFNRFLKYDTIHPALQHALLESCPGVDDAAHYTEVSESKRVLVTREKTYVLRITSGGMVVSEQRYPTLSHFVHAVGEAAVHVRYDIPAAWRRRAFAARVRSQKRVDHAEKLLVNIGAGLWYEPGWRNLDHSAAWYRYPRGIVDFDYDLTSFNRMPFPDHSVDLFYSEHVFEHLTDDCCRHNFGELRRALRAGGGLRIVVPDADLLYAKLVDRDTAFFEERMQGRYANIIEAFLILVAHPRSPVDERQFEDDLRSLAKVDFLNRYTQPMSYDYKRAGEHINWFNFDKLSAMLQEAGFGEVRRSDAQASRFPQIRGTRFDTRPSYSVHVDAIAV